MGAEATTATVKFKTNLEKFNLGLGNSGTVDSVKVDDVNVTETGGIYIPVGDPGASGEVWTPTVWPATSGQRVSPSKE